MLSLTLQCESIPEFNFQYYKAYRLHKIIGRFDKIDMNKNEFYDMLKSIRDNVKAIDSYYRNSNTTEIEISYDMVKATHIIGFRSNLYRAVLIAKQYYT